MALTYDLKCISQEPLAVAFTDQVCEQAQVAAEIPNGGKGRAPHHVAQRKRGRIDLLGINAAYGALHGSDVAQQLRREARARGMPEVQPQDPEIEIEGDVEL